MQRQSKALGPCAGFILADLEKDSRPEWHKGKEGRSVTVGSDARGGGVMSRVTLATYYENVGPVSSVASTNTNSARWAGEPR